MSHIKCTPQSGPSRFERRFAAGFTRLLAGKPATPDLHAILVRRVLEHIGRRDTDQFIVRPLGWSGMASLRFGAMVGAMSTANLCRCLAEHPDQAVELIIRHLDFDDAPPRYAGEFYSAGHSPVLALYHPAPDRFANVVSPRHGASPLSIPAGHLGAFEGERKRNCHGYDESYGPTQAMLSLIAVTFTILGAVLVAFGYTHGGL